MKTLLIVGKSYSGLESAITDNGHDFIVLKDTTHPAKINRRVDVDFKDRQALEAAAEKLRGKVDGIMCVYENYVLAAARLGKQLNLPHMPVRAAKNCTDKELMRRAFAAADPNITARFARINNEEELVEFAAKTGYPLILKPANLTKSLLVTKSRDQKELLDNYRQTKRVLASVYRRYAPHRRPKLVAEEFLDGPAYSVDAFTDSRGKPYVLEQVVDYQTGYDIGYDDNFHYSRRLPSALSQAKQECIRNTAKVGIKALGMRSTPAHVEVIYTKKGPRIIEIGARNGGYRQRMHWLANGLDLAAIAIDVALGRRPDIKAVKDDPCAVLELFPKKEGIFSGINHQDKLEQLPSLTYFKLKRPLGEFAGRSSAGYKMCAIIILHNNNKAQFYKDLAYVNRHVYATVT